MKFLGPNRVLLLLATLLAGGIVIRLAASEEALDVDQSEKRLFQEELRSLETERSGERKANEGKQSDANARTPGTVEAYDRAAARAFRQGAWGRAFELAQTAAAIVQSQGEWTEAAARWRRAALAAVTHPDAPQAHRTAILCYASAISSQSSNPSAEKTYEAALQEHLATWPKSGALAEVRWWQAKWIAARGDPIEAIQATEAITASDPHFEEATRMLLVGYRQRLERLAAKGAPLRKALIRATRRLQPLITGDKNRWPSEWSPLQRDAALALASMHLKHAPSGAEYAYRMMLAALTSQPAPDDAWGRQASVVAISAALTAKRWDRARACLQRWPPKDRVAIEALTSKLAKYEVRDTPMRQAAGEMILATLGESAAEEPTWAKQRRVTGLLMAGRDAEAIALLEELADDHPDEGALQERLATSLSQRPEEVQRQKSLELWRTIEIRSKPGDARWFRARIARLELLVELGRLEEASKQIALTRVLHPNIPGESLRNRFDRLHRSTQ